MLAETQNCSQNIITPADEILYSGVLGQPANGYLARLQVMP
jgi:hypothetical protein